MRPREGKSAVAGLHSTVVTRYPEMPSHEGGNPSQPALIVDSLGENFSFAKVVEDSSGLAESREWNPTVQPDVDTLLDCFATLGEMREGSERLLKAFGRFRVGGACGSLLPGLTEVGDGLGPD